MPVLNRRRIGGKPKGVTVATSNTGNTGLTGGSTGGSGTTTPPYVAPTLAPSTNATKFIATARASVVAPGSPVTVDIEFNGIIPTSGTITPSGPGSCNPSVINLDGTAKTFTYTPSSVSSSVEHNIAFSNSASLYNSAEVPLNVFASSSGSAQALGATLSLGDQAVHQRDTSQGKPTGFNTANTAGWGEVWVQLDRAVPALYARIYDRRSNGWSASVGSGTELTNGWVQVYGATTGGGEVRLLLPTIRAKQQTLELATDSAGTNPVRVAKCYAVGTVMLFTSRSQVTGYARGYAMPDADNNGVHYNKSVAWYLTALSIAADPRYADGSGTWGRVAGETYDPASFSDKFYGEPTSNGSMEAGRLIDQQTGTMLGITGCAYIGGGYDAFLDVPTGRLGSSTYDTAMAASRGKASYYFLAGDSFDNIPITLENYNNVFAKVPDWVMTNMPTVRVVGMATGASGYFGGDGSSQFGHTRMQDIIRQQEAALPHVVSLEDYHWNKFNNNHASQGARPPYVREHMRLLLSADRASWGGLQTQQRGPTMLQSGSHSGNLVRLPFKLNGAASVSVIKFTYSDLVNFTVARTTDPTDLINMVSLRPYGTRAGDGSNAYPITGAMLNMNNPPSGADGTIDVSFTVNIAFPCFANVACDFTASGGTAYNDPNRTAVVVVDNIDPFGVGYGQHLRPAIDIVVS